MNLEQKAIDMHTHFNHGSKYDAKCSEASYADINFLMKEYDSCNILCGAYSSFASVLSDKDIIAENEYTYKLSQSNDRVYQWVVIDPRQDETFRQADRILKSDKCLGIKIHSPEHDYDINEYGDKIFSYANEKNAFILMHDDSIDTMPHFADKYKNMNLIIAHVRGRAHVDAMLASKYGNIYIDTSSGSSYLNNVIEYAVERAGSERIFFGTDTYSCAFQYGRIFFARIKDRDKENILLNNALNAFGDKFKGLLK